MSKGGYVFLIIVFVSVLLWYLVRLVKYEWANKSYFKARNSVNKRYHGWDPEKKKKDGLRNKIKIIKEYETEDWEEVELKDKKENTKKIKSRKLRRILSKKKNEKA